ncbi:MAG: hypothetical protein HZC41_24020 [Chloroflexi bacterium]|nr:hypothetical protein [Chloroflexota bacterium]
MVKNGLIVVLIVAVVVLAAVAFTQFTAQQDATALARDAQTAQAEVLAAQATSVAQADAALLAQQTAETGRAAAERLVTAAAGTQAAAEVERGTAVAQAEAAEDELTAREAEFAVTQTIIAANATVQAQNGTAVGMAAATITAQAGELQAVVAALATATAQVDLADFARFAAEEDRAAALTQAYAAATALAQAQATLAAMQPATAAPTLPPATTAPTGTPAATTAAQAATPTAGATGTPVVSGDVRLNQTFTSPDGIASLNYPEGWLVQDIDGQIVMVNTIDALSGSGNEIQPGHFIGNIIFGPASQLPGLTADTTAVEFLAALREIVNARAAADAQLSEPTALTVGPYRAARAQASTANGQTLVIALQLGSGNFAVGFGNTAPDELDQFEPIFRAILSTLQYTP